MPMGGMVLKVELKVGGFERLTKEGGSKFRTKVGGSECLNWKIWL